MDIWASLSGAASSSDPPPPPPPGDDVLVDFVVRILPVREQFAPSRRSLVGDGILLRLRVTYDEEGRPLEQHHLIGVAYAAEVRQVTLQDADVRDQIRHDLAPRLVQGLVPYARAEALEVLHAHAKAALLDETLPVLQYQFPLLLGDEVHLVN